MENEDSRSIYGSSYAQYINNTLLKAYAHSMNYQDLLLSPNLPSEPHYVQMEAGSNSFSDTTFTTDSDPSSTNSTNSTAHIVTQIETAGGGLTWMSYQEGLNSSTGACPVRSSGFYAAKHDPFVFFQDVSGNPPSTTNGYCSSHHKAYTASSLQADLTSKSIGTYTFITPNLCNDMHGNSACTNGCTTGSGCISAGDTWLSTNLPALITFVNQNDGVIFIIWDEAESTTTSPFIAIGPHVKPGYASSVALSHLSLARSIDEILGLPVLPAASSANDFSDLFQTGHFP